LRSDHCSLHTSNFILPNLPFVIRNSPFTISPRLKHAWSYPFPFPSAMMMGRLRSGKLSRDPAMAEETAQPFRVLEHTADVGFEAFGRTREEVFANAARALEDLIVP